MEEQQIAQAVLPEQSQEYFASQVYSQQQADHILKIVLENEDLISLLEHEFRGEVLQVSENEEKWVKKYPPIIQNDEGINEILRMLRFMGLNKVSLLTSLDHNQINEKLKTFECKFADILFLKRKTWGIDKEYMPMIYNMIISIVEDACFRAKDGNLLKTLRTTYSNQSTDVQTRDNTKKGMQFPGMGGGGQGGMRSPYN